MIEQKEIIEQLSNKLSQNLSVLGLVLTGSYARESVYTAAPQSDLDIYIIAKDEEVKTVNKQLPDLVKEFGAVLFSFQHQIGLVIVYDNLLRLELPVIKETDLSHVFNRPKAQTVKVIFDKTDGKLQEALDKRPETIEYEKLFKDIVTNFWYWQITGVQYFKKGEVYNTRAVLNIHASALIKLFELENDKDILLLETNKRVEQFLTKEQLTLLQEVAVGYNPEEIKAALIKVMNIFHDVIVRINKKYNFMYDSTLEEKTKPKILQLLDVSS